MFSISFEGFAVSLSKNELCRVQAPFPKYKSKKGFMNEYDNVLASFQNFTVLYQCRANLGGEGGGESTPLID